MSTLARWFDPVDTPAIYVIAEAGVNHDGSVEDAHRLVDAAAAAGADAVKFQTFDPVALTSVDAPLAAYQAARTGARTQQELLAAYVLPAGVWAELQRHATDVGLDFLSTPFDHASLRLLSELGVPALKLGSGELTNRSLIEAAAGQGVPVLLSTGMGERGEVSRALGWLRAAGADRVALLHCVSSYPAPLDEANLRAVASMRADFEVPVGWSDHTIGSVSAVVAVALGATMVEKHLTLDTGRPGPDHAASADPAGFAAYVAAVRGASSSLGDGIKRPTPAESVNRSVVRRSWYVTRDLVAGSVLSPGDVIALRPEAGLGAAENPVGAVLAGPLAAGAALRRADLVHGEHLT